MFTITDILQDVNRGCAVHNMVEDKFSFRIVYFINFENGSKKYYVDASYDELRAVLENIIRKNLTTTNTVVLAAVTTRKNGETISLLSRSYGFNLSEYLQKLCGEKEKDNINSNYKRRKVQWG